MIIPTKFKPELCCSKDPRRYELGACYLSGAEIIATDGRRIIRIPVTLEDGDIDGFIPVNVLQAARVQANKTKKRKFVSAEATIAAKKETLGFSSQFGVIETKRPQLGNYPNYKLAIPEKPVRHPHHLALNVKLLAGIAEALGTETIILSAKDHESPITVEGSGAGIPSGAFGMLMPDRIN